MITYTVWIQGDGNIFEGYSNTLKSTHISKDIADKIAYNIGGYVEINNEELHPDYVSQLIQQDNELKRLVL